MEAVCSFSNNDHSCTGIHTRCIAHAINLANSAAFGVIQACISALRRLNGAIRISIKPKSRFEELQEILRCPGTVRTRV